VVILRRHSWQQQQKKFSSNFKFFFFLNLSNRFQHQKKVGRVESLRQFLLHGRVPAPEKPDPEAPAGHDTANGAPQCSCRHVNFHPQAFAAAAAAGAAYPALGPYRRSKSSERLTPRLSLVPGGPTSAPILSPLLTPYVFASFTPQEASRCLSYQTQFFHVFSYL
jgi:hypothetical protein